jgi:RNA polymerase sigma factor (sigma-70 family)
VTDERLVAAARAGDRTAFATLIDSHRAPVEAAVRRLLRDPVESEDVVQEAILRAYLGLEQLRRPDRFGSWLCGIALNLARMRLRQVARLTALPETVYATEPPDELGQLRDAIAVLPLAEREVVVMHYLNVFYASIALGSEQVDARPSDAINLAVRTGAPIFAEDEVLADAGFDAQGDVPARLEEEAARIRGLERSSGEWRPLPAAVAKAAYAGPHSRAR